MSNPTSTSLFAEATNVGVAIMPCAKAEEAVTLPVKVVCPFKRVLPVTSNLYPTSAAVPTLRFPVT